MERIRVVVLNRTSGRAGDGVVLGSGGRMCAFRSSRRDCFSDAGREVIYAIIQNAVGRAFVCNPWLANTAEEDTGIGGTGI